MSIKINAQSRATIGKNAARRARRDGMVPVVLYGPEVGNVLLSVDKKDLYSVLKSEAGENTIFNVAFDKTSTDVMIKDLQWDPVSDKMLHADLIQIVKGKKMRLQVPVVLTGEAVGVKNEGGFVDFVTREVEIECLPKDIPESLEVDISQLHLNQSIKIESVIPPKGVSFTEEAGTLIALVQAPTKEEEVAVEEEIEPIEGEEEPEVIAKEKAEESE